jgi:hypothetical protein
MMDEPSSIVDKGLCGTVWSGTYGDCGGTVSADDGGPITEMGNGNVECGGGGEAAGDMVVVRSGSVLRRPVLNASLEAIEARSSRLTKSGLVGVRISKGAYMTDGATVLVGDLEKVGEPGAVKAARCKLGRGESRERRRLVGETRSSDTFRLLFWSPPVANTPLRGRSYGGEDGVDVGEGIGELICEAGARGLLCLTYVDREVLSATVALWLRSLTRGPGTAMSSTSEKRLRERRDDEGFEAVIM